jgi:hypothetical protein
MVQIARYCFTVLTFVKKMFISALTPGCYGGVAFVGSPGAEIMGEGKDRGRPSANCAQCGHGGDPWRDMNSTRCSKNGAENSSEGCDGRQPR